MKSNLEKLIEALDADTNAFYDNGSYYGEFLPVTEAQHDQYYDDICQIISNGNTKAEDGSRDKRKEHVKKMLLDTDKPLFDLSDAKIKSKNDLKSEIRNC